MIVVTAEASCRNASTSVGPSESGASSHDEQIVTVFVSSGRPQPPPTEWALRVGVPVTVRTEGLGPPRVAVFGPDGTRTATVDAPLLEDGGVVGTEQRFTPRATGAYRLEHADVSGLVLARMDVR